MSGYHLAGFYVPWSAALAASAAAPAAVQGAVVHVGGIDVPIVQSVLAAAGVLLARPLAPRRAPVLGVLQQISVTLIMIIVAVAGVLQETPGVLFTFVVSIGLGFSGYALIETAGQQVGAVAKAALASMLAALENIGGKTK
jgi:hypothetical protein